MTTLALIATGVNILIGLATLGAVLIKVGEITAAVRRHEEILTPLPERITALETVMEMQRCQHSAH